MVKNSYLLLCVVAAYLTKIYAVTDEEKVIFRKAVAPIIAECSSEQGGSEGDINGLLASLADNLDKLKPCFIACVMKKTKIIDSKGYYDPTNGLKSLKVILKNDEDFAKYTEIATKCIKVNDEPVSDVEAVCERAKLVLSCALKLKAEVLF